MTLKETQDCCSEILKEFVSYCEESDLVYYLVGGSALGAIRHKGIIPWDDDVDVGMPRKDYRRFCEEYAGSERFKLMVMGRTEHYNRPYAKLCDKLTFFDEPEAKGPRLSVFIDIFPLDYIRESSIKINTALILKKLYSHSFLINLSAGQFSKDPLLKRMTRKLMSLPLSHFDPVSISTWITNIVACSHPTSKMMNVWGAWGKREIMEAGWFGEGCYKSFSGLECRIPSEWDRYLQTLYGDYMTPPNGVPHYHGQAYRTVENERFELPNNGQRSQ